MTETPRCCWYQSPSAFGSLARKKNPPIPVTFSISVPPAIRSRTAAPAGGGETFGCVVVCAAMPSWFRLKMKLDPKANDIVRSSWRLRKSIPSSFREKCESVHDTCANGFMGSAKMRLWGRLSATGSDPAKLQIKLSCPGKNAQTIHVEFGRFDFSGYPTQSGVRLLLSPCLRFGKSCDVMLF